VEVRGIGAMLQVFSSACRQSSLELLGPLVVGPGEPEHLVRGQPKITEHRTERLPRIDRINKLLPYLDGQACLGSGLSPDSLGVAVRSPAVGAYSRCASALRCRALPR
jgi:hypothetical protein